MDFKPELKATLGLYIDIYSDYKSDANTRTYKSQLSAKDGYISLVI